MTDDLHIFPFCRQSWNAALIEAITVVREIEKRPAGEDRSSAALKKELRSRMLDVPSEAA
jgi:hypothetical protein